MSEAPVVEMSETQTSSISVLSVDLESDKTPEFACSSAGTETEGITQATQESVGPGSTPEMDPAEDGNGEDEALGGNEDDPIRVEGGRDVGNISRASGMDARGSEDQSGPGQEEAEEDGDEAGENIKLFKAPQSRNGSPAPPNEMSELNEMDTTFMNEISEADQLKGRERESSGVTQEDAHHGVRANDGSDSDRDDRESGSEKEDDEDEEGGFHSTAPQLSLPYKEPEELSLQEFLERRRSVRFSVGDKPKVEPKTVEEGSEASEPTAPKRKSKIHEEILKAAALVKPQLSVEICAEDKPIDTLMKRAIVMQKAGRSPTEAIKQSVPGRQLIDLKSKLSEKIRERRKRLREERTLRIEGQREPQEEEEEEEEMSDEEGYEDEETYLDRAAKESDDEQGPGEDEAAEEGEAAEEVAEEEEENVAEEDEDSDIEESTAKRRSQKKKNAIVDSDDEGEAQESEGGSVGDQEDDLELKLADDDDEEEVQFMHLSQTQKPAKKLQEPKTALPLGLDDEEDTAAVDDDLLALCSGKFATQKTASEAADGNDDDEDDEMEEGEREANPRIGADFFENEAELSGSDDGGGDDDDDNMTEEEKRQLLRDLISENPEISDEALHAQVTKLHFKQLLDEDRKDVRLMKEFLLADGDLHSDGPGRERTFKWTNLSSDFVGGDKHDDSGDSEQEETEEEAKWKARRLEREKQKEEEGVEFMVAPKKMTITTGNVLTHDANISNILKEANKSLKIANPRKSEDSGSVAAVKKKSGGFLSMNNNVLQKIAEKVKGCVKDKEGSQTTKNFVFRTIDKPDDTSTKSAPSKRPSSDQTIQTNAAKKAKVAPTPSHSGARSIFSKF